MTTMYREDGSALEMIGALGDTRLAKDDTGETVEIHPHEDLYVTPDQGLRSTLEDLKDQIRDANGRLDLMVAECSQARTDHHETLQRIAELDPSLVHIEDYLLGKFTHFAFLDRMHVKTMEEALADPEYGRDGAFRLLTMRGKARRGQSPTWEVNQYHDGSGGGSKVVPCMSEEDAKKVIKKVISRWFETDSFGNRAIELADEFGVEVPEESRAKDLGRRILAAEKKELEDRHRAEKSSAHLDKIREECH